MMPYRRSTMFNVIGDRSYKKYITLKKGKCSPFLLVFFVRYNSIRDRTKKNHAAVPKSDFSIDLFREIDLFPTFHVDIIYVVWQRMLIVPPINPANSVCHNVRSI